MLFVRNTSHTYFVLVKNDDSGSFQNDFFLVYWKKMCVFYSNTYFACDAMKLAKSPHDRFRVHRLTCETPRPRASTLFILPYSTYTCYDNIVQAWITRAWYDVIRVTFSRETNIRSSSPRGLEFGKYTSVNVRKITIVITYESVSVRMHARGLLLREVHAINRSVKPWF